MPKITVDVKGEEMRPMLVPDGWYQVEVQKVSLEKGKDSGKNYLLWKIAIRGSEFDGGLMDMRTTLDKGTDPTKSKRWLFHQAMQACKIEKVDDKYTFDLESLTGKVFWVRIVIKEQIWEGNVFNSNEVKQVSLTPAPSKADNNKDPIFDDKDQESIPF